MSSDATPEGGLDRSAIHLLHRAGQTAGDIFAEELEASGLTPRQYAVLLTVAADEGLSQSDLVVRTGIDRSTLTDIVRRLLIKGLLTRRRTVTDARIYAVRLTAGGRDMLRRAGPAAARADGRLLQTLPAPRREAFLDALARIVADSGTSDDQP